MLRPAHLLRHEQFATWLSSRPAHLAVAICLVWIFVGLIGHDPWKSDEAYTFGVAYRMLESGDWIVPQIGATPFLTTPPLVQYGAAISAILLSPLLELHDGARLSIAIWMALTLVFTALTARELWGGNRTWIAPLMLIGCTGLLVRAHQIVTAMPLLAALVIGIYGLALLPRRSHIGGAWLGVGFGLAFLANGMADTLMLVIATIVMSVVSPRYRGLRFGKSVLIALVVALPLTVSWPVALYFVRPELFSQWLSLEFDALGELFVFGTGDQHLFYLNVLPWFAWPAWPFVIWSLWVEGKEGLAKRELQLPLVAFLAILAYLSLAGGGREINALPLLPPLALMAAISFSRLPRSAVNAYYWFSIMVATVFAFVAWVYFSALQFGLPTRLSEHIFRLQPAYEAQPRVWSFTAAVVVSVIWLVLLFNVKRSPERPVLLWAAGITTGWALAVFLLFHWVDARKTYRSMVVDLVSHVPLNYNCIVSQDVGDAQRAMLHYFGGIVTSQIYRRGNANACELLITQDDWEDSSVIGPPWQLIWEGGRSGDKHERYRLYSRTQG